MVQARFFCFLCFSLITFASVELQPCHGQPRAQSPEGAGSIKTLSCGCGAQPDAAGTRCICATGTSPLTPVNYATDPQGLSLVCGAPCGKNQTPDLSVGVANRFCRACVPTVLPCGTEAHLLTGTDGLDYKLVCKAGRRPLSELNPAYPGSSVCAEPCTDGSAPDPTLHNAGVARDPAACAYCKPSCGCGQEAQPVSVSGGQAFSCVCSPGRRTIGSILGNGDTRCFAETIPPGASLRTDLFDNKTVAPTYANRCAGFIAAPQCGWDTRSVRPKTDSSGRTTGDLEYTGACKPGLVHVNDIVKNGDMRCYNPALIPAGSSLTGTLFDSKQVDPAYADRCIGYKPAVGCGYELIPERDNLNRITGNYSARIKSGFVVTSFGDVARACAPGYHHGPLTTPDGDCRPCVPNPPPPPPPVICSGRVERASYSLVLNDGWRGSGSNVTVSNVTCNGTTPTGATLQIVASGALGSRNDVSISWNGGQSVDYSWYRAADGFSFSANASASKSGETINFSAKLTRAQVKHHGGGTLTGSLTVRCTCR